MDIVIPLNNNKSRSKEVIQTISVFLIVSLGKSNLTVFISIAVANIILFFIMLIFMAVSFTVSEMSFKFLYIFF